MLVLLDRLHVFLGIVHLPCCSVYPTIVYPMYFLSLGSYMIAVSTIGLIRDLS